ncbi:hypothetical protein XBO1_1300104 [Xenorhabdus bovienii str. oregonense]|uniref:Uncharacterized protein n=1 Tax=Xenorhabdus bovienii str. oregonense TaxID=1398202 RepID=A0A077P0J3_XENBV|nr:hypothetical protein XBO1_1300104 [Xenorhabdus bovienii str. oregonense]
MVTLKFSRKKVLKLGVNLKCPLGHVRRLDRVDWGHGGQPAETKGGTLTGNTDKARSFFDGRYSTPC